MTVVDQSTADTANSTGVLVASSATADTKGSWVELISSTSEETYWITLVLAHNFASVAKRNFLVDIAVGAAASESVQIADVSAYLCLSESITYLFPLTIPSGSRVSARCSNADSSATSCYSMIYLSNDDSFGTSTVNATFGTDAGNSKGTAIEADGTTDDTKGAYAELESSTSIDVDYIVVMIGGNDNTNITPAQTALVDFSSGAASSEVDLISNVPYGMFNVETSGVAAAFFQAISSGTRLAARVQTSDSVSAGAADRTIDVSVLGFTMVAPGGGGGSASVLGQIGLNGGLQ